MLNKGWQIVKTGVLTGGALINDIGSKLLGIKLLFKYVGINSPAPILISEIVTIISSVYVFIFSRGLTNWKLVSPKNKQTGKGVLRDIKVRSSQLGLFSRFISKGILLVGSVGGFIAIGLMSFNSSKVLFRYIGIKDEVILDFIDSFVGLTSGTTAVYFALRVGVKNLFCLAKKITCIPNEDEEKVQKSKATIAFGIGTIRMIAQLATVNLMIKEAICSIAPNLSVSATRMLSGVSTVPGITIFSQNRTIQLYRLIHNKNEGSGSNSKRSFRKIVCFGSHSVVGVAYISSYFALNYICLADAEEQFGFDSKKAWWLIGNLLTCSCGALVECAFTNKTMYRETKLMFFAHQEKKKTVLNRISIISPKNTEQWERASLLDVVSISSEDQAQEELNLLSEDISMNNESSETVFDSDNTKNIM